MWERSNPPARMRGRKLQRAREQLFDRSPLCVLCQAQGRIRMATIRDHVIPLEEGGRDDDTNVQAICEPCHDTKTKAEATRGMQRKGYVNY